MKCKKATPHNVRRVIKQRAESSKPLVAEDLRELAVEVGAELNVHPSCIMKSVLPEIESLLNIGDFVHIDGVLRPRMQNEQATPTKQFRRATAKSRDARRSRARRARQRHRTYLVTQQRVFRETQDNLATA